MTAALVLRGTAPEAGWLAARRKGVTASEIATVLGLSPWDSPYSLFHRKLGVLPEREDSMALALGRHLESFVADQFADRYPEFFWIFGDNGRALYAHPQRPWQLATPDRLLFEGASESWPIEDPPVAVLECKTSASYDGWGDDGTDVIPVRYRCQVLWQMDVMQVTAGYLACLFLHSRQLRVYQLALDEDAKQDLEVMRAAAKAFLGRIVVGVPPPVDWRPATTATLKALHPSVEDRSAEVNAMPVIRYRAACRAYKAAEQRKKLAENRLRELMGTARYAVLRGSHVTDRKGVRVPEVVARRDVYDVKEHVRKASTVDKLVSVAAGTSRTGTPQ